MAGHSKWHQIRHKKGILDSKRGKQFTKLGKNISVAARLGGGDIHMNPSLKVAVDKAKAANMTNDTITRAIKVGTGELKGAAEIQEIMYEAYAPGGVKLYIRALTDNRNRSVAKIREVFTKNGGSMGASGSVAYQFERMSAITIKGVEALSFEERELLVLECDADDFRDLDEDTIMVLCTPDHATQVRTSLEERSYAITDLAIIYVPTSTEKITDPETAAKILKVVELLEDEDDVDEVFVNFEIDDALLDQLVS